MKAKSNSLGYESYIQKYGMIHIISYLAILLFIWQSFSLLLNTIIGVQFLMGQKTILQTVERACFDYSRRLCFTVTVAQTIHADLKSTPPSRGLRGSFINHLNLRELQWLGWPLS